VNKRNIFNHPIVSVCIPVYNAGEFLQFAIESVLKQDFPDFELIIVDDCSTQPTKTVVGQFDDHRLSYYRNSHNLGLVDNWNRCINLAKGEFITIFHQDDVMCPKNLARKVIVLKDHHNVGLVYSNIIRIDEKGEFIGNHWIPQSNTDNIYSGQELFMMIANTGNPISCPSVIVRKECYERLGLFDFRLPFATDLEMWMRIAVHYDIGYLATPLIAQRVHMDQETARFSGKGKDYLDVYYAYEIAFSHNNPQAYLQHAKKAYKTLSSHAICMARWKFRQGRVIYAAKYLAVAIMSLKRANCYQNFS